MMHGALLHFFPEAPTHTDFYVSIVLLGLMTDLTHQKSAVLGVRSSDAGWSRWLTLNVCTFRWNPRRDFLPRWAGDVIGVRSARIHIWRAIKITHDRLGFHKCEYIFFAAPRNRLANCAIVEVPRICIREILLSLQFASAKPPNGLKWPCSR